MDFRRIALPMLLVLFSLHGVGAEVTRILRSSITAATVYSDRAVVTRKGTGHFAAGQYAVRFTGLPPSLNDQSVRVSGAGTAPAKILDVRVESVFTDSIVSQRLRGLQEKLKSLNDQLRKINDRIAVLNQQKEFLNKISVSSPEIIARDLKAQRPAVEDWQKLLGFLDANLTRLNEELFDLDQRKSDASTKISGLQSDWNKTGVSNVPREKQIVVGLEVQSDGDLNFETSYLVPHAGWKPLYDIRVSSADNKVELSYHGVVWQSSGEDWNDINLSLSTAQPAVGGVQPQISPWYVDQYGALKGSLYGYVRDASSGEALVGANVQIVGFGYGAATDAAGYYSVNGIPVGSYEARVNYLGYTPSSKSIRITPNQRTVFDARLEAANVSVQDVTVTAERPIISKSATHSLAIRGGQGATVETPPPVPTPLQLTSADVSESATSATFEIPTKSSIPSDNTKHKVTITVASIAGEFSYSAAPKLRPNAFFKVDLSNSTEYPLLSGSMSVFVDNGFVTTSQLSNVAPGERFDAYLGVDNGIRVERILVSKLTETGGVFSKTTKVTYNAIIKIENLKKTPQVLTVQDNIPFSQNERIEVRVDSPKGNEATRDANGVITWRASLNPGEKREFKLIFSVEYPSELNVTGLE